MIQVADNFNYRGKKPNFDRDSFDTLQDMKNYSENSLDDGHISYCKVHYSIGNNSNYRTYTINPGISIIMETEIENITMFPAGNNRPDMPVVGYQYFDTTINKPIFYDGSKWIDATGATV